MTGNNITNIYLIDGKKFTHSELSQDQKNYNNSVRVLDKYNQFREELMSKFGEDLSAKVKICVSENTFSAFS